MDDSTFALLKLFAQRKNLSLLDLAAILNMDYLELVDPVTYLFQCQYLRKTGIDALKENAALLSPSTSLEITYYGKTKISLEERTRKNYTFTEIRAWITLAIAVLGFCFSIFSLYLQYIT